MCHPRPSSIPRRSGDQIKTDRRDARSLAKYFAAGLLTEYLVLDQELESALSRSALIKNLHRSKMQITHLLHARRKTDNEGRSWAKKVMVCVHLDQPNDEHMLQGDLADIDHLQSRIREIKQQIQDTAALPRFQEVVWILQGFRGIGLITAMQPAPTTWNDKRNIKKCNQEIYMSPVNGTCYPIPV